VSGETLSVAGDTYRLLVTGEQTGGTYAVIDMLVPPGGGPGPHAHPAVQESFFVLGGEIQVMTETQTYIAAEGALVAIPYGGLIHSFKNLSLSTAHLLCVVVPAGLDRMFREIGAPVEPGAFLPQPDFSQSELKRLQGIAEKYGQRLYPPDYLD
jgi:quercetin dioxygenase-like cupin family protein